MPIALYHVDHSASCEKVRLALGIEQIAFESLLIEEDDRSEVLRLSGQSEVPVLVDSDGSVLFDANRILRHLAASNRSRLLPAGRRDQTLTWVLVERADVRLAPVCRRLALRRAPEGNSLRDEEVHVLRRRLDEELAVIEGILERGPFLFGDRPTVADVAIHAYLNRLPRADAMDALGDDPKLSGWFDLVLESAGRRRGKRRIR